MKLFFVDLETTGLTPSRHSIIDIAIITTNEMGMGIKEYNSKARPTEYAIEIAEKKALEVNKYNANDWAMAPEIWQVDQAICETFGDSNNPEYIPIGWNINFDVNFMMQHFAGGTRFFTNGESSSFRFHHHSLDLMSMGWPKGLFNFAKKPHLSDLCQLLSIPVQNEHTALGDVKMYLACYLKLLRR